MCAGAELVGGECEQGEDTDVVQDPLCYDFFQQLTQTFEEGDWSVALRLS
jgi:hypothetical protein